MKRRKLPSAYTLFNLRVFAVISSLFILALASGFTSPYCKAHPAGNPTNVKAVDFCNFSYPGIKRAGLRKSGWPDPQFTLKEGVRPPNDERGEELIILENVRYEDVTNSGRQDAIVTLVWHSGGTMYKSIVYVWSLEEQRPKLLWSFASGDRAYSGLYDVYGRDGDLIVELNDPASAIGDCCARRFIRKRYHWNGSKFEPVGKPETLPNHEYDNVKD